MEILLGQRCPRKEDDKYKRPLDNVEIEEGKAVYVCCTRRSLGLKGGWDCADCNFPEPLFANLKRRR